MAFYRFHVRDPWGLIEDDEGLHLPDLTSALKVALQSTRELMADEVYASNLHFEVADENGRTVLTIPIRSIAQTTRDH